MAPIVNDSDEEGDLDDFAGGEVENEALPSCDDHTRDDRTQGTRPTERLLGEAQANPANTGTPTVTQSGLSSRKQSISSGNLKRAKSVGVEEEVPREKSSLQFRRDDWDVTPSSSPSKDCRPVSDRPLVIVEQGSTIMNSASSAERHVKELQEAHNSGDTVSRALTTVQEDEAFREKPRDSGRREKRRRKVGGDERDADELAIGLPKEQYQPRPSRSRSHQLTATTSGSSQVKSDPLQESRPKRRKTADMVRENDREVLQSMGFRSSQADRALRETNGNVEKATDWLLDGGSDDHKQDLSKKQVDDKESTPPPKGRGRPRKTKTGTQDGELISHVVLQSEAADGPMTLDKQETVYLHIPNDDIQSVDTQINNQLESNRREQRKGRGRPKKIGSETLSKVEVSTEKNPHGQDLEAPETRMERTEEYTDKSDEPAALQDTEHNRRPSCNSEPDDRAPTPADQSTGDELKDGGQGAERDMECLPTPSRSLVKMGKVPLRVGLSKRMRIPSLLTSAKKDTSK